MKKIIITLALLLSSSVVFAETTSESDTSWQAFCSAYGYDPATTDSEIINQFLDTWSGSIEEENALKNI